MPQRYSGGVSRVCHPASIEILRIYKSILAFQPFQEMPSSHRVEELWLFSLKCEWNHWRAYFSSLVHGDAQSDFSA